MEAQQRRRQQADRLINVSRRATPDTRLHHLRRLRLAAGTDADGTRPRTFAVRNSPPFTTSPVPAGGPSDRLHREERVKHVRLTRDPQGHRGGMTHPGKLQVRLMSGPSLVGQEIEPRAHLDPLAGPRATTDCSDSIARTGEVTPSQLSECRPSPVSKSTLRRFRPSRWRFRRPSSPPLTPCR